MVTTSSNKGFSVPTVGGDAGVWGNELNTTITDLDTILGGSLTFNASAAATVTLSASQAQFNRIVFSGTPTSSMQLNFMSSGVSGGYGNFNVWNATSTSANSGAGFNILCQVTSTSTGATTTIPVSNMRVVNVDVNNAQLADQVIIPTITLPPVLTGYLSGLTLSNSTAGSSAGSSNTFLAVASGIATDTTAFTYLQNAASFIKTSSAPWALGSLNGGMGAGLTFTAGTTYHVFLISNGTSSNIDAYFDTSVTAANKPANTNFWRRIGALKTTSSAAIWKSFTQNGDEILLAVPDNTINGQNFSSSLAPFTLNFASAVPSGVEMWAKFKFQMQSQVGGNEIGVFYALDMGNQVASTPTGFTDQFAAFGGQLTMGDMIMRTNNSAQIGYSLFGGTQINTLWLSVYGYIDTRGRDTIP